MLSGILKVTILFYPVVEYISSKNVEHHSEQFPLSEVVLYFSAFRAIPNRREKLKENFGFKCKENYNYVNACTTTLHILSNLQSIERGLAAGLSES